MSNIKDKPTYTSDEFTPIAGNLGQATKEEMQELIDEVKDLKKDFMLIIGIFASFIAFISIEAGIFKSAKTANEAFGLSCFILAGLLSFNLLLRSALSNNVKDAWRIFLQPTPYLIIGLLVLGALLVH